MARRLSEVPPESEKHFMGAVIDAARALGWQDYHQWLSIHSRRGWPDLVLLRPPRALFIELKAERGKLSPVQHECLGRLEACHQEVHVWRPSMWKHIMEILR